MTNFSGEPISSKTANAACGGPQGGGMDSRRNGVAEVSPKYLAEAASNAIPVGYKQTEVGVIPEDWQVIVYQFGMEKAKSRLNLKVACILFWLQVDKLVGVIATYGISLLFLLVEKER